MPGTTHANGSTEPTASVGPSGRQLPPLRSLVAVAAGGAVGGTLRYVFIHAFPTDPGLFPWVIFLENLTGSFLLGVVLTIVLDGSRRLPQDVRPFLTTGVLGSFTTFSNFTFDVVGLTAAGAPGTALVYALASMSLGIAAALVGVRVGRAASRAPR